MKKNFLFVGAMIAMFAIGMSTVLVSCEKDTEKSSKSRSADDDEDDEDEINGCKCTIAYDGEELGTEKYSMTQMKKLKVKTCSALKKALLNEMETLIEEEGYDLDINNFDVSCKEY